ncbi:MarR family winged helix-turn-helix transcriptional regulator [Segatella paludivivens]|uniref:MarR family winged helix-turn-helix transcriptional regulator n=1 Tax=Segatella paludivivens TaxID=185294 RepID=UPI00036CE78C|nr:MarR family transcriptional regulator [Segatella paludivivens]
MIDQNSILKMGHVILEDMFHAIKKRIKDQAELKLKITTEQFKLLHAIDQKKDEVIQKDMADMMGKNKSTILRLIDSLETKGLVKRVADTKDRRKNYLMVTKKGKEIIKQYKCILKLIIEDLQEGLTESELNTFYKVAAHFKDRATP